ncbi:MAG TPA: host specificity factor TipJ family phage tail protein, partial [Clostridia bacterium]|nr:host specificity factor TipJ family phage tail protein [Clostridia bacterium]
MENNKVLITASPHPFYHEPIITSALPNQILADVLDKSGITFYAYSDLRVLVNGILITKEQYETLIVKENDIITVKAVPHGGGGKNILRVVAMIAITAITFGAGSFLGLGYLTAYGLGLEALGSVGFQIATFAFSAAWFAGGMSLINAICPVKTPTEGLTNAYDGKTSQSYALSMPSNKSNIWGPVPLLLGHHRFYPPYAAKPYTSVDGENQFLHLLFCAGYNNVTLDEFKLGETDITEYMDTDDLDRLEMKVHYGFDPSIDEFELVKDNVDETPLSIELLETESWNLRTTEEDVTEISVDITAPKGMYAINEMSGAKESRTVNFEIQYAPTGTSDWSIASAGEAFLARNADVSQPTVSYTVDMYGNLEETTGYSYTRIGLDKATGEIKTTENPGTNSIANAKAYCPSLGKYIAPVCGVLRNSANTDIVIDDLRTDELDRENTTDFLASVNGTSGVTIAAGTLYFRPYIRGKSPDIIRRSYRFKVTSGQYDVRVRRTTADTESSKVFDEIYWTSLRSYSSAPIVDITGLILIEMRIKASDTLNGSVEDFNFVYKSNILDWDSTGETWVTRGTNNPASIIRELLQGSFNANPRTNAQINLTELQEFHEYCADNSFSFNMPIDYNISLKEALDLVASVGRASHTTKNGKHTVVVDRVKDNIIQHFTARNTRNFSAVKTFTQLPHAYRIVFADENSSWNTTEFLVYADGYGTGSGDTPATYIQTLDLKGITNSNLIWKQGRFHLAQQQLRPETYSIETDIDNIICTRGDRVKVQHYAPLWGLGTGRVKSVTIDGSYTTAITVDEIFTTEAETDYAIRCRLADGTSVYSAVTCEVGEISELTFESPILTANAPAVGDLVSFGELGYEMVDCIVLTIKPGDNLTAVLELVDYSPAIFDADTGEIPEFDPFISSPVEPSTPTISYVRSDDNALYRSSDGTLIPRIMAYLQAPAGIDMHKINAIQGQIREYSAVEVYDHPWENLPSVTKDTREISIMPVEVGHTYRLRFRYLFNDGTTSSWCTENIHTVVGATGAPSDPTFDDGATVFEYSYIKFVINGVADLDLQYYEIRRDTNFGTIDSNFVGRTNSETLMYTGPITATDTYYIKARNTAGVWSANSDSIASVFDAISIENFDGDFYTNECHLTWKAVAKDSIDHYVLNFYSEIERSNLIGTSGEIYTTHWILTETANYTMNSGYNRNVYATLSAVDSLGRTVTSDLDISNDVPNAPSTPTLTPGLRTLTVRWTPIADVDIISYDVAFDTNADPTTIYNTTNTQITFTN